MGLFMGQRVRIWLDQKWRRGVVERDERDGFVDILLDGTTVTSALMVDSYAIEKLNALDLIVESLMRPAESPAES
jgi:hypothetical protein